MRAPADVTDVAALAQWLASSDEEPLIVPTSGSTGAPKMVVLSRDAVLASAGATAARLGGEGAWVQALPLTGIAGIMVVVRSLLAGHQPVLFHGDWSHAVEHAQYTSLVPTQLQRILGTPDEEALASLDAVLVGGASAGPALVDEAKAVGINVVRTYGMTETCGGCVYDGVPLDGVDLKLIDGRVAVRGPVLFDGYVDQPRSDAWFLTSDLGEIDDGVLSVTGRSDDVAISGGVNVPTRAVVDQLREVPGVDEVEVLGVPDEEWGHRIVAFVVGEAVLEDLRAAVHPHTWAPKQLVTLDALPVLPSGKVDRQALIELTQ